MDPQLPFQEQQTRVLTMPLETVRFLATAGQHVSQCRIPAICCKQCSRFHPAFCKTGSCVGWTLSVMIYICANISGAHLNSAVRHVHHVCATLQLAMLQKSPLLMMNVILQLCIAFILGISITRTVKGLDFGHCFHRVAFCSTGPCACIAESLPP